MKTRSGGGGWRAICLSEQTLTLGDTVLLRTEDETKHIAYAKCVGALDTSMCC